MHQCCVDIGITLTDTISESISCDDCNIQSKVNGMDNDIDVEFAIYCGNTTDKYLRVEPKKIYWIYTGGDTVIKVQSNTDWQVN